MSTKIKSPEFLFQAKPQIQYHSQRVNRPIVLNRLKRVCELHKTVKQQCPKWLKNIANFIRHRA